MENLNPLRCAKNTSTYTQIEIGFNNPPVLNQPFLVTVTKSNEIDSMRKGCYGPKTDYTPTECTVSPHTKNSASKHVAEPVSQWEDCSGIPLASRGVGSFWVLLSFKLFFFFCSPVKIRCKVQMGKRASFSLFIGI